MSQLDQVSCDLSYSIDIVVIDRVTEILDGLIVNHNDGHTVLKKLPTLLLTERGGTYDDSICTVFHHSLDNFTLPPGITMGRCDKQTVATALNNFFNSLQYLAEKRIIDAGENNT
jgi:hypothetical protein